MQNIKDGHGPKQKRRKGNKNKDNPCSHKKNSTREKYISKSIVELG